MRHVHFLYNGVHFGPLHYENILLAAQSLSMRARWIVRTVVNLVSRMTIEHGLTEPFTLDLVSLGSEVPTQLT